jgi:hypothetical protein
MQTWVPYTDAEVTNAKMPLNYNLKKLKIIYADPDFVKL